MAKRASRKSAPAAAAIPISPDGGPSSIDSLIRAALSSPDGTTGRFITVLQRDAYDEGLASLKDAAGLSTVSSADYAEGVIPPEDLAGNGAFLAELGIVISSMNPDQLRSATLSGADSGIRNIYPERLYSLSPDGMLFPPSFAPATPGGAFGFPAIPAGRSLDYITGYVTGASHVLSWLSPAGGFPGFPIGVTTPALPSRVGFGTEGFPGVVGVDQVPAAFGIGEGLGTWGLRATGVLTSTFTGDGVRVAILDTGLDLTHPDFQDGRIVAHASFVGQPVQDVPTREIPGFQPGNPGHGTHCIGTACGPKEPSGASSEGRYGIAFEAQICVGKVFTNQGLTVGGSIMEGIAWAIKKKCRVISMSLGAAHNGAMGDPYTDIMERAVRANVAVFAAAGNRSRRSSGIIQPVDSPANNIRVMAVGAVDENLRIADFSNRGQFPPGGAVDVVGPGVRVYSTLPMNGFPGGKTQYGFLQGTSMATPHVAGVAALLAQAKPQFTALDLLRVITQMAQNLPSIDSRDVGNGLVQSP